LLERAKGWAEELGIPGYDYIRNRGDLRFFVTRHAINSDQLMLVLVTASRESAVEPLLEKLAGEAESVVWEVQERVGDDSRGEVVRILGRETLVEQVGDQRFHIGPNTFFQNNLLLVKELFDAVAERAEGSLMDLYCGTGTLGLAAAQKATDVLGVEIDEENIELARLNARENGIESARFVADNANHFLAFYEGEVPDTVIVDPPRSGLAPRLIRKLNRLGAPKVIYVSCNPKSWAQDLELFEGYELADVTAFDMFPQTPHLELVSVLRR
jgi:23S rRNA (uracil-5-)-methyltransferase RumA